MRNRRSPRLAVAAGAVVAALALTAASEPQAPAVRDQAVDRLFAQWTQGTPGCAVGVSEAGTPVLTRAYGMADLERDVPNTPATIFEAGSVSKQFTAAAVLLLARDGKLALDDPIRKYIPEVPDYGTPVTIRHMLTHTSGLRDWGSVADIGGWPRTTRVYTHADVIDIVSRQRALNFSPGTRYSYSNTGYNLAAVLVERVSGMPFAEFSQQRIFGPVGMTRTSWRDDHRRIVKGRAQAYSHEDDRYRTLMPFENVHGNGGLLTTVGDLLLWNRHLASPAIGDAAMVRQQEEPGRFADGRAHGYALGLRVGTRHGLREIGHSGSTAGYRAHLTRFPDRQLSVAVLCNAANADATAYAGEVADVFLAATRETPATNGHTLTEAEAAAAAGLFRYTTTGEAIEVVSVARGVRLARTPFVAESGTRFTSSGGDTWQIAADGSATLTDRYGTVDRFERVTPAAPSAAELQALAGTYVSEDAETELTVAVEGETLVLKRRPDTTIRLSPLYRDAFSGSIGTVLFRRDAAGPQLSVVQDRVWDMRFVRRGQATPRMAAAPLSSAFADIDRLVTDFAAREHVPGAAWGLIVDGALVHVGTTGFRELGAKSPVTRDTVFRIASMTKSFTAMAILALRDEGKLALDDPAERYVPELKGLTYPTGDSTPITIRHLLSHATGFPEDNPWGDQQLAATEDEFTAMMRGGIPFSNPPGVAYEYSNYGFAILGRIVSNVAKMPYRDYIAARILKPLGMSATTLEPAAVPPARLAHGYRWEDEQWNEEEQLPDGAFGAMGGMLTSLDDLGRYVGAYLAAWPPRDGPSSAPISRASLREMQQVWRWRPATVTRNPSGATQLNAGGYGYGLRVTQSCDYAHIVAHSGGLPGFGSLMQWLPEYGVGFIAMGNRTYTGWGGVASQVFDRLRATGALTPRMAEPSEALIRARDQVSQLVIAWDDARADRLAAVNLFRDRSRDRRRREIEQLRQQVGACTAPDRFTFVENALRGTWTMTCERGALDVAITLAPTMPPTVQYFDVAPSRPQSRAACAP